MKVVTIRLDDDAAEYRRVACAKHNVPKKVFDQKVYDFYIEHHRLDTNPDEQKEPNG
jgi:hypothetical protein